MYIYLSSFHASHCAEAIAHTEGHLGKALEILFYKYYGIENLPKREDAEKLDLNDLLQRRIEEKEALESIYSDTFTEKIKNQIWLVNIKLDYLVKNDEDKKIKSKPKVPLKEVCRLYLQGKCRFGIKCRFLHHQPEPQEKPKVTKEALFTLEIRFPDGKLIIILFFYLFIENQIILLQK